MAISQDSRETGKAEVSLSFSPVSGMDKTADTCVGSWYENAVCMLKNSGRKLTRQRKVILLLFDCSPQHLTAQEVHELVAGSEPDINLVTVYRTLELLADVGILSKINFNDGAYRYERKPSDAEHHHHLICTECGRVVEFLGCAFSSMARQLETATGFAVDGHSLKLTGKCAPCQEMTTASSPGTRKEEQ
jgi:Fur family ferric uptake transcriptional regulator